MPKPSSIKTVQILLYLKLLLIAFILLNVLPLVMLIVLAALVVGDIVAVNRRKRTLAIAISSFLFLFSLLTDMINLVLSFAILILLFTRSSREYFARDGVLEIAGHAVGEETEEASEGADAPEAEEAVEGDGDASDGDKLPETGSATEADGGASASASAGGTAGSSAPAVAAPSAVRPKPSANPEVEIRQASADDASIVHEIMLEAFEEYRAAVPPSSALSETLESVRAALEDGSESAAILTEDGIPAAVVRYRVEGDAIYFFRLSVRPARRKRGYARRLIEWIEWIGRSRGLEISRCKVRQSVSRNLVLYENMGYEIKNQELVVRPDGSVKTLTMEKRLMTN